MQHVEIYLSGSRDYYYFTGDTGPLVYPGLHVYIYRALHYVTDGGKDILKAQIIFGVVYLLSLSVVMACYRRAKVSTQTLKIIGEKRIEIIWLLTKLSLGACICVPASHFVEEDAQYISASPFQRLFCGGLFVVRCLSLPEAMVDFRQHLVLSGTGRQDERTNRCAGTSGHFAPGIGTRKSYHAADGHWPVAGIFILLAQYQTSMLILGQILWGFEFIRQDPYTYFPQAFQLTRQFMYKWTVNWRFIDEKQFLSWQFSAFLLASHVALLVLFGATRWIKPFGRGLKDLIRITWNSADGPYDQFAIAQRMTPSFIMTTLFTANAIGMLYARSLHYQFYSWTAWATPWLLAGGAKFEPAYVYLIWATQEWAWNTYPSTKQSSLAVVLMLALQARGVYAGTEDDHKDVKGEDGPVLEVLDERGNVIPDAKVTLPPDVNQKIHMKDD